LRRAFEAVGLPDALVAVRDGQETMDYLSGAGVFSDREKFPEPAVMLLDLKMPRVDGFEVLVWRNQQEQWRDLPIIVLSSSGLETDVQRALALGADAYRIKPSGFHYLVEVAREMANKWLGKSAGPSFHAPKRAGLGREERLWSRLKRSEARSGLRTGLAW
jgi:CheY-like chemotaxis protein